MEVPGVVYWVFRRIKKWVTVTEISTKRLITKFFLVNLPRRLGVSITYTYDWVRKLKTTSTERQTDVSTDLTTLLFRLSNFTWFLNLHPKITLCDFSQNSLLSQWHLSLVGEFLYWIFHSFSDLTCLGQFCNQYDEVK